MDRGTYVAASGGYYDIRKLDVATHNLANTNTPGFKRQLLVAEQQQFSQTLASSVAADDPYAKLDHDRTPGVVNVQTVTDFSQGPIAFTENPLNVALRKTTDFFVINTPQGPQYTRAGNFTLNKEGNLVTPDGFEVAGDGGAITADGPGVSIAENGEVIVNKTRVGKLSVVRFADTKGLDQVGSTRFTVRAGATAQPEAIDNPEVIPRSLEMSNVSVITGVLDLITAQRGFQAYTKSAETMDNLNQFAISRIGVSR